MASKSKYLDGKGVNRLWRKILEKILPVKKTADKALKYAKAGL